MKWTAIILLVLLIAPIAMAQTCQEAANVCTQENSKTRTDLEYTINTRFEKFERETESFVTGEVDHLNILVQDNLKRGIIVFSISLLGISILTQALIGWVRIKKERGLFLALNDNLIKLVEHMKRRM